MTLAIAALDAMPPGEAQQVLGACCGSPAWITAMDARRPFGSRDALLNAADEVWAALSPSDWLDAFAHHPRIGEREAAAAVDATASSWSSHEQAQAMEAPAAVRANLAVAQQAYEARFGHIFLICASGQTAEEIRAALVQRMGNEPAAELRIAAEEQRKITRLRLEKLVSSEQHAGSSRP